MSEVVEKVATSCPHCRRSFHVAAGLQGKRARCPCGLEFTIAAAAPPETPPPVAAEAVRAAVSCRNHPGMPAVAACRTCRAMLCQTCDVPTPDGSHLCPACSAAAGRMDTPTSAFAPLYAPDHLDPAAATARVSPFLEGGIDVMCRVHPAVQAIARCRNCSAPVCGTCDFAVAPGVHLCPTCATAPPKLSSTRKAMAIWSMLAAGWVTFMIILSVTGALAAMVRDPAGASVLGSAIIFPGLIGLALSCGSLDRRAGNPPLVWGAVAWNSVLAVIWAAFIVIGLTIHH